MVIREYTVSAGEEGDRSEREGGTARVSGAVRPFTSLLVRRELSLAGRAAFQPLDDDPERPCPADMRGDTAFTPLSEPVWKKKGSHRRREMKK